VGDYENGRLYALDLNTFTDDGDEIYQERAWHQRSNSPLMADFLYGQLYAEFGLGLDGDPPSDWAVIAPREPHLRVGPVRRRRRERLGMASSFRSADE
jgi:hypothetical protein